jgi:hypothetical protein
MLIVLVPVGLIDLDWAWRSTEPLNLDRRPEFKGRPLDGMLREWGKPALAQRYTVGEVKSMPFRSALVDETHSVYEPAEAGAQIREVTWQRWRSRLTVWFHLVDGRWTAFEAIECHKRMQWPLERVPTTLPASDSEVGLTGGR